MLWLPGQDMQAYASPLAHRLIPILAKSQRNLLAPIVDRQEILIDYSKLLFTMHLTF
ncbi:hypothetical protein [Chamaesiphon sp.]|uniref:hypothetical protein n=1 Tax=Chamaesiphon sp. TaxID=2814140 RepID=UPI0035932DB7